MEKDVNKLIAQRKFNIAINFIDKLDILMALQDKSEDNEESKLINFTRNSKDLKVHFLLDNNNYRISSEKVFDNYFNTFTNINDDLKIQIKESLYLSHSSLYKVKKIEDDYIILFDLLLYKEEKVSKDLLENIELNDYLFARIAQFNNYNYIIHILNILNKEIGEIFYSMILEFLASSFNKNVKENRKILFLKENLIDIFIIFGVAIKSYEEINSELEDIAEKERIKKYFFKEKDSYLFDLYISYILANTNFEEDDIYYLLDLMYREYLEDLEENYSTFENFSFIDMYKSLSENGIFLTNSEFYNSIYILKKLYYFLEKHKINTSKAIKELNYISNNIFIFQNMLKNSINGFYFDENLLDIIPYDIECEFLKDFEDFLKYIELLNVLKSETKDMIIPTHVKKLSDELNLKPIKSVKNINQNHFPLINLFYNFAKTKSLIEIERIYVLPSLEIEKYLYLTNQEKYSLFIYYILKEEFLKTFLSDQRYKSLINTSKLIVETIIENKFISLVSLNLKKDKRYILDILKRLNLINIDMSNIINITPLGEDIYNFYIGKNKNNKIIQLKDYKKDL